MPRLRAFHNDPHIQAFYLARVRAHQEADELTHGNYWDEGKGCAVGCTLHSSNHAAYETELGIPCLLAHLEDYLFEHLPAAAARQWPLAFLQAPHLGADLSLVWPHFLLALLTDPQYGVRQYCLAAPWKQQGVAIDAVIELYVSWIATNNQSVQAAYTACELTCLAGAAWAAEPATWAAEVAAAAAETAAGVARAGARAATWTGGAAVAAAETVAAAAEAAAEAATWARGAAARAAHLDWQATTLLRLLAAAPVPSP